MLTLEDDHALGLNFAERLRVNGDLAWISYSAMRRPVVSSACGGVFRITPSS